MKKKCSLGMLIDLSDKISFGSKKTTIRHVQVTISNAIIPVLHYVLVRKKKAFQSRYEKKISSLINKKKLFKILKYIILTL